ncbi:hypothetical protein [Roseovarius sp. MBR-6]|uniref:hypothetical protein n=1 Tax=Roseovarius sp. MBR-6 TaxID=3156459 RepID=UPI0033931697
MSLAGARRGACGANLTADPEAERCDMTPPTDLSRVRAPVAEARALHARLKAAGREA